MNISETNISYQSNLNFYMLFSSGRIHVLDWCIIPSRFCFSCWYTDSYEVIYRLSFLFEVQLLRLSLHIEVLSFEDSEWSRGR